ncbi:transposase [Noviherbaspirillum galbum]|uniref:Transposase n=1 Tax=Noviherbaspirillum galbum TaxID=2709383 RepID=A0A6B3ST55_9BURK|nr:transposase [Noviherbaspirillum galbum]NEX63947.1 transposase [Noviherbaspirillum galbum]
MRGKQYSAEFRAVAVKRMLHGQKNCRDLAHELGVTTCKLNQWFRKHLAEHEGRLRHEGKIR